MSCHLIDYSSEFLAAIPDREQNKDRITACIEAASLAIERYCGRGFALQTYEELLPVNQFGQAILGKFPVTRIIEVKTERVPFLTLRNTQHASASVSVDEDRVVIRRTGADAQAYLFESYETVGELVEAIDGNAGWTATSLSEDSSTEDLVFGVFANAKNEVTLQGWINSADAETDYQTGVMTVAAPGPILVEYEAGFDEIPTDVQEVCGQIVANMFDSKIGSLASESLGGYSYSVLQGASALAKLPLTTRMILNSYRSRSF